MSRQTGLDCQIDRSCRSNVGCRAAGRAASCRAQPRSERLRSSCRMRAEPRERVLVRPVPPQRSRSGCGRPRNRLPWLQPQLGAPHAYSVRAKTQAIPSPCAASRHSQRSMPRPYGGLSQIRPCQGVRKPSWSAARKRFAGIQGKPPGGAAGSRSKVRPSARKTAGGVYHSTDFPAVSSCRNPLAISANGCTGNS